MISLRAPGAGTGRIQALVGALVIGVVGLGVGVALGVAGNDIGPWVMVALPAAALWMSLVLTRPVWASAAFFLSLPVGLDLVGSIKFADLAIVVTVAAVAAAALVRQVQARVAVPALGWGLAMCATLVLAVPGAIDVGVASARVITVVAGFLLAAAILAACERFADVRFLVYWFLAVGVVMAVVALSEVSQFHAVANGIVVTNRATGVFNDPNELGSFSVMLLMVSIGVSLAHGIDRRIRLAATAIIGLGAAALIVSLSRGAWIGAVFGIVGLAFFLPQARRRLLGGLAAILLVGATIGAFAPTSPTVQVVEKRFNTITTGADRSAAFYDSRPQIWAEAFRELRLHPWFGVGPANFVLASAKRGSKSREVAPVHAHDVVLTVAVEAGLPAAFFLVGMTVAVGLAALRALRRLRGTANAAIVAGVAAALWGEAGHGIIDNTTLNPVILGSLWLFVGVVLAADRLSAAGDEDNGGAQPDSRRASRRNSRVEARPALAGSEYQSSKK